MLLWLRLSRLEDDLATLLQASFLAIGEVDTMEITTVPVLLGRACQCCVLLRTARSLSFG